MLRLIHTQTEQGGILVDDIDDGLPNKQVHRLEGDPDAYKRDGYANKPKQPVYIPRTKPTDATVAGYIDLNETERVIASEAGGKIAGLTSSGQITVVSLVASDLDAPAATLATFDDPASGDVTIDGTDFASVAPNISSVRLFGPGVGDVTLTTAQILAVPPGAVSDVEIIIDSTLAPGLLDFIGSTGTFTSSGVMADGEVVTLGTKVYTFQAALTDVDGNVLIGVSQATSMENLRRAINLDGVAGTNYALSMTAQPEGVTAVSDATTVDATAPVALGDAGNAIVSTTDAGNGSWGAVVLENGVTGDDIVVTADDQDSNTQLVTL